MGQGIVTVWDLNVCLKANVFLWKDKCVFMKRQMCVYERQMCFLWRADVFYEKTNVRL